MVINALVRERKTACLFRKNPVDDYLSSAAIRRNSRNLARHGVINSGAVLRFHRVGSAMTGQLYGVSPARRDFPEAVAVEINPFAVARPGGPGSACRRQLFRLASTRAHHKNLPFAI